MTLKTWSFSKKHNSTAQPAGSSRDYTVYLKENTSIEAPVFILGSGIDADISYAQAFGNYYFVDDIVMISKDQVEVHCSIDVLATHKTAIGNYSAFIERSASAHNAYLIDDALSATQQIVSETMASTDLFTADQDGCFIVRCVSPSISSPTGIASFVMDNDELKVLLDFITTDNNFSDVLSDSIVKSFFNPFQYIISIMWFPVGRGTPHGMDADLQLGWWQVPHPTSAGNPDGKWKLLDSPVGLYEHVTLNKPTAYYANDFRVNTKSFTSLQAYIPGLGVSEVDPMLLSASAAAEVCIDYVTGSIYVALVDRGTQGGLTVDRDVFGSFSGQIGVPIQCGQWQGMGSSVVAMPDVSTGHPIRDLVQNAGIAFTAATADVVSGAGSIVKGILNMSGASRNVYGDAGNMSAIIAHPRLILYQRAYGCAEFPNTHYGRPLCSQRTISTLSGFVKCAGASIALNAPETEIVKVNTYLNSGFYYE